MTRLCFSLVSAVVLTFSAASSPWAQLIRCPATRDVWLSGANHREADTNGGRSPRIKLKVCQEFGLFDFDVSALVGKKIVRVYLRLASAGGEKYAKGRGTDLRWFTASTVSSPWEEGLGKKYSVDRAGRGATFNEASCGTRPWTVAGSRCWDVILGNGNTLREDVDGGHPVDGWFAIPLPPRLVEAMVAGASHGLLVMDGSTGADRNCFVSSREGGRPPCLDVEVAEADTTSPPPPCDVEVKPAARLATPTRGAARVSFTVPVGAFAYRLRLNGDPVPRWKIPFAGRPGTRQDILLEELPPRSELEVEVAAVDGAGNASRYAAARGKAGERVAPPALLLPARRKSAPRPPAAGQEVLAWAFPELCKLDPVSVSFALEERLADASRGNAVWDAATSTIRLAAARGEIVGFQLALEPLRGRVRIGLNVTGLTGLGVKLWRTWFVPKGGRWQAEYAIPFRMGEPLTIPAADNGIQGQRAGVVAVDLIVPHTARPGKRRGTLAVSTGNGPAVLLRLELEIFDCAIPDEIHFNPELNGYSNPGPVGSDAFFDAFRLAHYHRCTINRVSHSHVGQTDPDWTPTIDARGRVVDWATYDRHFGSLLDGSAFRENPRRGVPVPTFYLPHNESWPLRMVDHYDPGVPVRGARWKEVNDILGKPPERAFSAAYQEAFASSVADFARHFSQKGWNRTTFQCFFNNKWHYSRNELKGTAWDMDEPVKFLDWNALRFFSRLFHKGSRDAGSGRFVFRGDISRPMWQGSAMDGLMEMLYANGSQFGVPALMRDLKRRSPTTLSAYGECNPQDRSNLETALWCIKAYLSECDGVLPWQSLGLDAAFTAGDTANGGNALIVDGRRRFGCNAVASYRVHALRAGAQLVELLRLLEEKRGWGRRQSLALVSPTLSLAGRFEQGVWDEAAPLRFPPLDGNALTDLKVGVLGLLTR